MIFAVISGGLFFVLLANRKWHREHPVHPKIAAASQKLAAEAQRFSEITRDISGR